MKLTRLSSILHSIKSQLASYSTTTTERHLVKEKWSGSLNCLYRKISPIGDPTVSIVPVLDQWVREGGNVDKEQLDQGVALLKTIYTRSPDYIHGRPALERARRKMIALGTASGLLYLHEQCDPKIIHRHVKATNIC